MSPMRGRALVALVVLAVAFAARPVQGQGGGGSVGDSPPTFPVFSANRTSADQGSGAVVFTIEIQEPNGEDDIKTVGLTSTGAATASPAYDLKSTDRKRVAEPTTYNGAGFKVWTGASEIDGRFYVKYEWNVSSSIAAGVHSWRAATVSATGVTTLSSASVNVTVILPSIVTIAASPVSTTGTTLTGATFGAWNASPGDTYVSAGNYLKITNSGSLATARVVLDFSGASFAGATDTRFGVAIANNVQFAWWEDTTPSVTAPNQGTYAYLAANSEGSVTLNFTATPSIVYVTYRLVALPAILPAQAYGAAFTVTEL